MILMLKGYLGHKACKSHRDYSAFPSLSVSCSLFVPCSLFYCILSYLLTNMKYSLREFISLVTNTELNNSAFVYNDVYLYMTTSFLLPVCFFFICSICCKEFFKTYDRFKDVFCVNSCFCSQFFEMCCLNYFLTY